MTKYWVFKKQPAFFIIMAFAFTLFNEPLISLIDNTFVKYFFSQIKASPIKDCAIIVLLAFIIFYYIPKFKGYVPAANTFGLLLFFSLVYCWYRFFSCHYTFTPFWFLERVKYLDSIIAVGILNTALFLNFLKSEKNNEGIDKKKNLLFDDMPVEFGNPNRVDLLGYTNYATELAKSIDNSSFDKSFAIGINGRWGIGKTSFINILKCNLTNTDIIVEFNPWNSQSPEAIIQDFFNALQEEIRPYHASLARKLVEYSNRLLKIDNGRFISSINLAGSTVASFDSLNSIHVDIDKSLKKINRRLVVIVDDLDRLNNKEIIEVLKLIRNTANFYNTFFIVAYDRNYVINAISKVSTHRPESYLDKIFQIEITLPYFNKNTYKTRFLELLRPHFNESINKQFAGAISTPSNSRTVIDLWLDNMRDATRLANSMMLNFKKLENEVYLPDFVRLELLRLKYPSVYEAIFRRTDEFFVITSKPNSRKSYYQLIQTAETSKSRNLFAEVLKNQPDFGIPKHEIEKVNNLVSEIFYETGYKTRNMLSVCVPSNFKRYFTYTLLNDDLSEVIFSKTRQSQLQKIYEKIDIWIESGLEELVRNRYTEIRDFDDSDDFEKVIQAIFYLARQKSKKETGRTPNLVSYDLNDIIHILDNSDNRIAIKYYNREEKPLHDFVYYIFKEQPSIQYFPASILKEALRLNLTLPLTEIEMKSILCHYLNEYCENSAELDYPFDFLLSCCVEKEIIAFDNNVKTSKYRTIREAKEIALNFFIRNVDKFINWLIKVNEEPNGEKTYAINEVVYTIWADDWDAFKTFILSEQLPQTEKLIEFKDFLVKFEEVKRAKFISYPFKSLPSNFNYTQLDLSKILDGNWELEYTHSDPMVDGGTESVKFEDNNYFIRGVLSFILTEVTIAGKKITWTKIRSKDNQKHSRESLIIDNENRIEGTDDLGYRLIYTKNNKLVEK